METPRASQRGPRLRHVLNGHLHLFDHSRHGRNVHAGFRRFGLTLSHSRLDLIPERCNVHSYRILSWRRSRLSLCDELDYEFREGILVISTVLELLKWARIQAIHGNTDSHAEDNCILPALGYASFVKNPGASHAILSEKGDYTGCLVQLLHYHS